jgi:hypothetical protein
MFLLATLTRSRQGPIHDEPAICAGVTLTQNISLALLVHRLASCRNRRKKTAAHALARLAPTSTIVEAVIAHDARPGRRPMTGQAVGRWPAGIRYRLELTARRRTTAGGGPD